ncbi:hypothetical protein [Burkholderia ubonensis]|uniref:hypothetical protein n=1 Tax=Burkholderia ubonensis TaxID=101571 RepID=UPI0012F98B75|nr:hypothetical protein [Burkholderia ubonensis]
MENEFMGQKFAAYDTEGNIVAFYDSEDSPLPDGADAIKISDAEWMSCISTPGYMVKNGLLVAPTPDQIAARQVAIEWLACQSSARSELSLSDVTVLRCYENAIPVPAEWVAYRKSLRAIISAPRGDPTQVFPNKPSYPVGT